MATAEQIKALIKSHVSNEEERFVTATLQLASYEAHRGHTALAREIRSIIENKQIPRFKSISLQRDLSEFVISSEPKLRLSNIVLKASLKKRVSRILRECRQRHKLLRYGMENRRKILLVGHPGTGKTMTASVIAGELKLPLHVIQMDRIVTKFMGETSAKLRQVFNTMQESRGVFFFDEFDAIGSDRGKENDVGEMRRVLNSFLQFIENDTSESIIIGATNNMKLLDQALFRRFDDILCYELPSNEEAIQLIKDRLASFLGKINVKTFVPKTKGLSHAEIVTACYDAVKESILDDKKTVSKTFLAEMFKDKMSAYKKTKVKK